MFINSKRIWLACIFLLSFVLNIFSQNTSKDSIILYECVSVLSSDSLQGRFAGSKYEQQSAKFIISELDRNGIKPFFNETYTQLFTYSVDSITYSSQNIIGFIDNESDSLIIIVAHYDHIGMGGKLSKSFVNNKIHPGADDNASGVSAVLFLSKYLQKSEYNKNNYMFLFFGAHEVGLFGSTYFINSMNLSDLNIKLLLNLDMIGRLDTTTKTLLFETNYNCISAEKLNSYSNNQLTFQKGNKLIGDHTLFIKNNINSLFLSTGVHQDYHKISDTKEKLNYLGLITINKTILNMLKDF